MALQSMPGEALTVQCTAGGPGLVPPSGLSLLPRCPWGPLPGGLGREEILASQADQAR